MLDVLQVQGLFHCCNAAASFAFVLIRPLTSQQAAKDPGEMYVESSIMAGACREAQISCRRAKYAAGCTSCSTSCSWLDWAAGSWVGAGIRTS